MQQEQKVILRASCGAALLAGIKMTVWLLTGSLVLIASAVDSLLDLGVSVFNLFALKHSSKPADQQHNYGHGKIEGIAALIEGVIITGSAFSIIYSAVQKLIVWSQITDLDSGIIVMIISLLITWGIVFLLQKTLKTSKNLILKADLLHYKMDFLTNAWILLTLLLLKWSHFTQLDPIIAILIALYILYSCKDILRSGFDILMDKSIGKDQEIWSIILAHPEVQSFHHLKTHQSGKEIFISFHMVFKDENIALKKAHFISLKVKQALQNTFKNAEILIKLDPFDDK